MKTFPENLLDFQLWQKTLWASKVEIFFRFWKLKKIYIIQNWLKVPKMFRTTTKVVCGKKSITPKRVMYGLYLEENILFRIIWIICKQVFFTVVTSFVPGQFGSETPNIFLPILNNPNIHMWYSIPALNANFLKFIPVLISTNKKYSKW